MGAGPKSMEPETAVFRARCRRRRAEKRAEIEQEASVPENGFLRGTSEKRTGERYRDTENRFAAAAA